MWTILHVLFFRMRQIVLGNAGQLRCKPLIQPDESCLQPVPHKLHWFTKLAQREGERRVATSAHLYNETQGLGRDSDHLQGGTGDCPPSSSPTRVTLGHRLGKEAVEPREGAGSRTAWDPGAGAACPLPLRTGHCCLPSPASVKISSVINYLQTFWSENRLTMLSTTLKFTLSELCYLLLLFPAKNLHLLFLLIARALVGI